MLTDDVARWVKGLGGRAGYRRRVSRRLSALETRSNTLIDESIDMVQMHLLFLDHLSRQSETRIGEYRDYRTEFLMFYLQQRPEKRRLIGRHEAK